LHWAHPLRDDDDVEARCAKGARRARHRNTARRAMEMLDDDLTHRKRTRLKRHDERPDRVIAEIRQELCLPVVEGAFWKGGIQHVVQRAVRKRAEGIDDWRAKGLQWPNRRLAFFERSAVCPNE